MTNYYESVSKEEQKKREKEMTNDELNAREHGEVGNN